MNCKKVQTDIRAKSISDDDICASCANCCYCPGTLSMCKLVGEFGMWPAVFDADGYAINCTGYKTKVTPIGVNLRMLFRYGKAEIPL